MTTKTDSTTITSHKALSSGLPPTPRQSKLSNQPALSEEAQIQTEDNGVRCRRHTKTQNNRACFTHVSGNVRHGYATLESAHAS